MSRQKKRERGIWKRRYWEHQIWNNDDLLRHVDYIHYNPVNHGLVKKAVEWPHTTLHGYIVRGMASHDWECSLEGAVNDFGELKCWVLGFVPQPNLRAIVYVWITDINCCISSRAGMWVFLGGKCNGFCSNLVQ